MNLWIESFILAVIISCCLFGGCFLLKDKEFMNNTVLIRHGAPSQYDHAPLGTTCKVMNHTEDGYDLYIQYADDESNPRWEYMGFFSNDDTHLCDKINAIIYKDK